MMRAIAGCVCAAAMAGLLALAAPAHADVTCYASVKDEAVGEMTAGLDVNAATGKTGRLALFWTPERAGGDGGAGYFGWPGLMLDYQLDKSGALVGPVAAEVLITQVSRNVDGRIDRGPPISSLRVRVEAPDEAPITWREAVNSAGHIKLAKLLRDKRPAKLKVDLMDADGGPVSWSAYEFTAMDKVAKMAAEARGMAEQAAADFSAAAARGETRRDC
jgi:hypothetical protein